MTFPSVLEVLSGRIFARKLLWLLILTTLVVVTLIIVPLVPTKAPAVDSKIMAIQSLLWMILLAAGLNYGTITRRDWTFTDTAFGALLAAFFTSMLFSGRFGYSFSTSWHQGALVGVSWIIYRLRPALSECKAFVWTIGSLAILCSLYGFLAYIGRDILKPLYPFTFDEEQGGRNFIHSFLGNPEYFAGYAAPSSVIMLGIAFQPHSKLLYRGLWLGATAFVLMLIVLSGSRSALLGFLAGAVVQFLGQVTHMQKSIQRLAWMAATSALILGIAGVTILSTPNPLNRRDMRLLQRYTDVFNTRSDSLRERLLFYTTTAYAIPQNPMFGYGPGTYRLEFLNNVKQIVEKDSGGVTTIMLNELNRKLAEHTHNDYLEILFDQGLFGFGAFLLLLVHAAMRFVITTWRTIRSKRQEIGLLASLHASIFAAFLTMCLNALTSFPFQMPARSTLAWLLIGVFFAIDSVLHEALQRESGNSVTSLPSTKAEEV